MTMEDFKITGALTILLPGPYVEELPVVTRAAAYFCTVPELEFNFKLSETFGDVVKRHVPWLKELISDTIHKAMREEAVLPNRIVVEPALKNVGWLKDIFDKMTATKFAPPLGVLRFRVISGQVMAADKSLTHHITCGEARLSSDAYFKLCFGAQTFQSVVQKGTLNPVWEPEDGTVDFVIYSQQQTAQIDVFDHDGILEGGAHDFLGRTDRIPVSEMMKHVGEDWKITLDTSAVDEETRLLQPDKRKEYFLIINVEIFSLHKIPDLDAAADSAEKGLLAEIQMLKAMVPQMPGKPVHATAYSPLADVRIQHRKALLCLDVHGGRHVTAEECRASRLLVEVHSPWGKRTYQSDKGKWKHPMQKWIDKRAAGKDHLLRLIHRLSDHRNVSDRDIAALAEMPEDDVRMIHWERESAFPVQWKSAIFRVLVEDPSEVELDLRWEGAKKVGRTFGTARLHGEQLFQDAEELHFRRHLHLPLTPPVSLLTGDTKKATHHHHNRSIVKRLSSLAAPFFKPKPGRADPEESSSDSDTEEQPPELDVVFYILWLHPVYSAEDFKGDSLARAASPTPKARKAAVPPAPVVQ
mmetsp:Transcript_72372/g.192942  ORF Transcript_72372/g.192942 Transcript_72372/m.192942 type:complete len:582 (+) Transcript_72372:96-1841(+)